MSTKTSTALITDATALAISATVNGASTLDCRTGYGGMILVQITNTGGALTTAATATVNHSIDGSTWKFMESQSSQLPSGAVSNLLFRIPLGAMYLQLVVTGGTGSAATVGAQATLVTAL